MTDGPFKNLKLGKNWKRFAEAVQNETVDTNMRCSIASHAILQEVLAGDVPDLINRLQSYFNKEQLDIDPLSSIENIFADHSVAPFADTLEKELSYRLNDGMQPIDAFSEALEASIDVWINKIKNRIEEQCIHSLELKEMWSDQCNLTIRNSNMTLDNLDKKPLCNALLNGDKLAFKSSILKKAGIDDGPTLL